MSDSHTTAHQNFNRLAETGGDMRCDRRVLGHVGFERSAQRAVRVAGADGGCARRCRSMQSVSWGWRPTVRGFDRLHRVGVILGDASLEHLTHELGGPLVDARIVRVDYPTGRDLVRP